MNKIKFKITKKVLYNLYRKQKLSMYKIGQKLKCHATTINKLIIKHNIPVRTQSEYMIGNKHCKSGKYHWNWKGGVTKKVYYCKEKGCDNKITYNTALYRGGRCCSCSQKEILKTHPHNKGMLGKHHTKKSKIKMITTLQKHHIYLEKNSNDIMKLTKSKHMVLHHKVYEYLYEIYGKKGIDNYIKWFDKKYKLKG